MKEKINYKIRKSARVRQLSVVVYRNGDVVIVIPRGLGIGIIDKFIREKADWILKKIRYFKRFKNIRIFRFNRNHYLKHKNSALELAIERIEYFNKIFKFEYNKISVKNQKTRWGSCSTKKNLNFNYRILFLPPKLRDYIIVHELCHLEEFNHSRKFWNLVVKTASDYSTIRKELRKNGFNYY